MVYTVIAHKNHEKLFLSHLEGELNSKQRPKYRSCLNKHASLLIARKTSSNVVSLAIPCVSLFSFLSSARTHFALASLGKSEYHQSTSFFHLSFLSCGRGELRMLFISALSRNRRVPDICMELLALLIFSGGGNAFSFDSAVIVVGRWCNCCCSSLEIFCRN